MAQQLLLFLLAPELVPAPDLSAASVDDWSNVAALVEAHRLAPLIDRRLEQAPLPSLDPALASKWNRTAKASLAEALVRQADLVAAVRLLSSRGLESVALKGADLAWRAYDEPGRRPMRDIDLLLRDAPSALAAFEALTAAGWQPLRESGDTAAAARASHQLPLLVSPDGGSALELHLRMTHEALDDAAIEAATFAEAETRDWLGTRVLVPPPAIQYAHLVVHAARDHRFDNGPQLLADLAALVHAPGFDAAAAAAWCRALGVARPASLLAALASRAFPHPDWPQPVALPPEDVAEGIALIMALMTSLPDRLQASRAVAALRSRQAIADALWPSRDRLDRLYGLAPTRRAAFTRLAGHYWRLATRRRRAIAAALGGEGAALAAIDAAYARWLDPPRRQG